MTTSHAPVAVIGGGPIGLITALGLVAHGVPTVVFEADAELSTDTKAGTVLTRTLEVLDRYGAVEPVLEASLRIDEIGELDRATGQSTGSVLTSALIEETRFPFVINIPQHELEPVLADELERRAPGTLRLRHRLEDFTEHAGGVTLHLSTPDGPVTLEASRVAADLDHAIWALDQPSVDGLNSYWISKLAAEAGFKVALSGQGGDELFGGYPSLAWFGRFTAVARWARPLPATLFGRVLDRPALPFRWRKLSYLIGADDPFVASQMAVKILFLDRDVAGLLSPALGQNGHHAEAERHLSHWSRLVEQEDLLERLAFMDIHTHLEPRLLRDLDAMSMAHSIEVRPVFLDHRLVEFLLPVPSGIRIQQKRLLLDAAKSFLPRNLLEDLETRRKRTFTFPFKRWITRDLHRTMQEAFSQRRLGSQQVLEFGAVDDLWRRYVRSEPSVGWSRIWSLFVLQRWCEIMQVSP